MASGKIYCNKLAAILDGRAYTRIYGPTGVGPYVIKVLDTVDANRLAVYAMPWKEEFYKIYSPLDSLGNYEHICDIDVQRGFVIPTLKVVTQFKDTFLPVVSWVKQLTQGMDSYISVSKYDPDEVIPNDEIYFCYYHPLVQNVLMPNLQKLTKLLPENFLDKEHPDFLPYYANSDWGYKTVGDINDAISSGILCGVRLSMNHKLNDVQSFVNSSEVHQHRVISKAYRCSVTAMTCDGKEWLLGEVSKIVDSHTLSYVGD